jgi:hypothetical protein
VRVVQRTIAEIDWRLLRLLHPLALERFSERVLAEIEGVMHPGQSAQQRYLDVFEIVQQRGREMARIFDDQKRSRALMMLAQIHVKGLLTEEEFQSLSPETRGAVIDSVRSAD